MGSVERAEDAVSGGVGRGTPAGAASGGDSVPVANPGGDKLDKPVPISDGARGHSYLCFEGPLGAHLKMEQREKIWRREYLDIFTLLPLDRFPVERWEKGKEHRKEEDEDRRRYRLIPRTFSNWLQAFSILGSVVGERSPELCSSLFCYMDVVGEAYRVYGGSAWLRYDEQFRQRMSVRPELSWGHRDIGIWLRVMNSKAGVYSSMAGPSPFQSGSAPASSGAATGGKKGICWVFNDSQCKWGATCRFKHECSGCGGGHPFARCFKKGKGQFKRPGEPFGKREEPGERSGDGSLAR